MPFDYAQLWNDAKKSNLEKYISDNLSTNNIALGFLDSVGKKDSSALQNAIAHSQNAGNARESEAANMAAQQEQNMINAKMQRDQANYAAEGNARMMLANKSNEIAGKINEIKGSYDYGQNPENYNSQIAELTRQKAEIDSQLEASTKALTANPHYQGETLVNPVSVQGVENSSSENRSRAMELKKLADNFVGALNRVDLDKIPFGKYLESLESSNSLPDGVALNDIKKSFDESKAERQKIHKDVDSTAEALRNNSLAVRKYGNEKVEQAKKALELNAQFNQVASAAKTQEEFEKMLEGGILGNFAKNQGLDNTTAKGFALELFKNIKSKDSGKPEDKKTFKAGGDD